MRRILFGAFALSWRHRRELARATGLPILAVIACTLIQSAAGLSANRPVQWTLYFVYAIALSWLAISVHRLVLLGDAESKPRLNSVGLKQVGRFVFAMIGIWLAYVVLFFMLFSIAVVPFSRYVPGNMMPDTMVMPALFAFLLPATKILALWPIARLSLLFPALAVDQSFDPIAAWRKARGNVWKLAIVVGALPWTLRYLVDALYRDEATWVEFGALLVLTALFTVIQVVALSLSYWELTQPEPPPTPPPA